MRRRAADVDLGDYLDREVYPALFERLDQAFPDFCFEPRGRGWVATRWPADFPEEATDKRPDRLEVYPDRPWWIKVHGHGGVRFLDLANGGRKPVGPEFPAAVRTLCERAGVPFPERDLTPEEEARLHQRQARRDVLEGVIEYGQAELFNDRRDESRAALAYLLDERGFTAEEVQKLELGFYARAATVRKFLETRGYDLQAAEDAAVLWPKLEGYILVPWRDAAGQALTLYSRWPAKTTPDERPKTLALPGEGTKASPLYFDRARAAGHRDLVAVEGVFDAALLQVRGDTRVVAYVGAQFSGGQVETLQRYGVGSVVVCPDPDGGGDRGALASVRSLAAADIRAHVTPRLPDGLDPDEFLQRDGLEAWRDLVSRAVSGPVHEATVLLGDVGPTSPPKDRRDAVDRVLDLDDRLRGPGVELDREDLLQLLTERTGYTLEGLSELFEDHHRRRDRDETEKRLQRLLRESADKLTGDDRDDVFDVAADLSVELAGLVSRSEHPPPAFSVDRLHRQVSEAPAGKPSGWDALDRLDVRFQPQELALVAGRTSHAKTTVLVNLLANWLDAGAGSDELLVFYSAEEPEERIFCRLVGLLTAWDRERDGWSANEVRAKLRGDDPLSRDGYWPAGNLDDALERLRSWEDRLLVVHRPGWTIDRLVAHAKDLAARQPVGAVFVDYLQRIPPPADIGKGRRRDEEVSSVARLCKHLAGDLSIPVVAGAQINREAVKDAAKVPTGLPYEDPKVRTAIQSRRPQIHHLREGGSEQEADLVLGLLNYRADYSETEDGDERPDARTIPKVTRLEIGSLKNRFGEVGKWAGLALCGRLGLVRDPERGEVD